MPLVVDLLGDRVTLLCLCEDEETEDEDEAIEDDEEAGVTAESVARIVRLVAEEGEGEEALIGRIDGIVSVSVSAIFLRLLPVCLCLEAEMKLLWYEPLLHFHLLHLLRLFLFPPLTLAAVSFWASNESDDEKEKEQQQMKKRRKQKQAGGKVKSQQESV